MSEQDAEVAGIQRDFLDRFKASRRWIIVEESDGSYSVHEHTWDGVAPPSSYPDKRKAAARLLQLLGIGPVAPQTWPEAVCVGEIRREGERG